MVASVMGKTGAPAVDVLANGMLLPVAEDATARVEDGEDAVADNRVVDTSSDSSPYVLPDDIQVARIPTPADLYEDVNLAIPGVVGADNDVK